MKLGSKLDMAKDAIRSDRGERRPGDDFALFAFSDGEVRPVAPFPTDPAHCSGPGGLEPEGETALFDAVAATPSRMVKGKNGKRAIVLFTDGVDNASRLSTLEMAEILQQVSTPVYAVGMKNASFDRLTDKEREELSVDNLKMLAASSGGKMYLAGERKTCGPVADQDRSRGPEAVSAGVYTVGPGRGKIPGVVVVRDASPGPGTFGHVAGIGARPRTRGRVNS